MDTTSKTIRVAMNSWKASIRQKYTEGDGGLAIEGVVEVLYEVKGVLGIEISLEAVGS